MDLWVTFLSHLDLLVQPSIINYIASGSHILCSFLKNGAKQVRRRHRLKMFIYTNVISCTLAKPRAMPVLNPGVLFVQFNWGLLDDGIYMYLIWNIWALWLQIKRHNLEIAFLKSILTPWHTCTIATIKNCFNSTYQRLFLLSLIKIQ